MIQVYVDGARQKLIPIEEAQSVIDLVRQALEEGRAITVIPDGEGVKE